MRDFRIYLCVLLVPFCVWVQSCGGKGGSGDESVAPDDEIEPAPLRELTGSMYFNDLSTPATGFQVLLVNHTTGNVAISMVTQDGSFSFSLSLFRRRESYSFHILDQESRYITVVAFDGSQTAIRYQGGGGFTMPDLLVVGNNFGFYDVQASVVEATTNESFATDPQIDIDPSAIMPPEVLQSATMASELVVNDLSDLLYGIYRRQSAPNMYAQVLARHSRFGLDFVAKSNNGVASITLSQAGVWAQGARVANELFSNPIESPFWQARGFDVSAQSQKSFYSGLYPGYLPRGQDVGLFDVKASDGSTSIVMVKPRKIVALPPLISQISLDGDPLSAVDYLTDGAENGLNLPFCLGTEDVFLLAEAALDRDHNPLSFGDDLSTMQMQFSFFQQVGSSLLRLEPTAADFPNQFELGFFDNTLPQASREWKPATQELSWVFTLNGPMISHELPIFREVFLGHIFSLAQDVHLIRVQILYKGSHHKAGIVAWFKHC